MTTEEWVGENFERCWPWLDAALATMPVRTHGKADVLTEVVSGRSQLWAGSASAVVVETLMWPTGARTLHNWIAGGDLEELERTAAAIEEYGRANGFDAITVTGRPGWARALDGYRTVAVELAKDLR